MPWLYTLDLEPEEHWMHERSEARHRHDDRPEPDVRWRSCPDDDWVEIFLGEDPPDRDEGLAYVGGDDEIPF